jgi:integrase
MPKRDPRKRHLKRRGEWWWLRLAIAHDVRHHFPTQDRDGKPTGLFQEHKEESLHTTSLTEADRIKHGRIEHWNAVFRAKRAEDAKSARAEQREHHARPDALTAEAYESRAAMREALAQADRDLPDGYSDPGVDAVEDAAVRRAESIDGNPEHHPDGEHGPQPEPSALAKHWYSLATNVKEPTIREAWAEWMKANGHDAATRLKDEQALRGLFEHLKLHDTFPSQITHAKARAYVKWLNTEAKSAHDGEPLARATRQARIGPLRYFWNRYLRYNEIVPQTVANPWEGHEYPEHKDHKRPKKRPYEVSEMLAVLNGPNLRTGDDIRYPKRTMIELYCLTVYTGARIGEICNRRLRDVKTIDGGYTLNIPDSKTPSGVRCIPILHPLPVTVLKGRIGDRTDPEAQLFAELIPGGPKGSLMWYVAKAMGRYRRKVGLSSATDTHSLRRHMITLAVNKGLLVTDIQFYVGHKPEGITRGVYTFSTEQGARAVANAIRYPDEVEQGFKRALGLS